MLKEQNLVKSMARSIKTSLPIIFAKGQICTPKPKYFTSKKKKCHQNNMAS